MSKLVLQALVSVVILASSALTQPQTEAPQKAPGQPNSTLKAQPEKLKRGPTLARLFRRRPIANLLQYPSVRKELKTTPAQDKRFDEVSGRSEKLQELLQNEQKMLGERPDEIELAEFISQARERQKDLSEQINTEQVAVLDRRQRLRVRQVQLQAEGPLAFQDQFFQERLNLSPEQVQAIAEAVANSQNLAVQAERATTEVMSRSSNLQTVHGKTVRVLDQRKLNEIRAAEKMVEKNATDIMQQTNREVAKILSKKQRANYQKMLGEPFDLSTLVIERPSSKPSSPGD